MIYLCFEIDPVAQSRARMSKTGHAYKAEKSRTFEQTIGFLAKSQYRGKPLEGPLVVTMNFVIAKPKSSKKPYPDIRPDISNYIKAIEDALNGIVYFDDAQIIDLMATKRYGSVPLIVVSIAEAKEGLQ